jgi:hypothetical protein
MRDNAGNSPHRNFDRNFAKGFPLNMFAVRDGGYVPLRPGCPHLVT